jgi:hypothetical protein
MTDAPALRARDEAVQKREEEDTGLVIHMEGLEEDMRT